MRSHFIHFILLRLLPGIWIVAGLISVGLFLFTDMNLNKGENRSFATCLLIFGGCTLTSFYFPNSDWFAVALLVAAMVALIAGLWIKASFEIVIRRTAKHL